MSNISLYPVINPSFINEIISVKYKFYYEDKHSKIYNLTHEQIDKKSLKVNDPNEDWNYCDNGLYISVVTKILSLDKVFVDPKVACADAKIGYGIEWYSQESRQRGFKSIGLIDKDTKDSDNEINIFLKHKDFKESVNFDIVFYIDTPGSADEKQKHFANEPGIILGSSRVFSLVLEGSGSIFPIMSIMDETKPLWEVKVEIDSIDEDPFTKDYVCIYLNKSHKDYKFIDKSTKDFNIYFLKEVLSSAVSQVVIDLLEKREEKNIDNNSEEGTIQRVLYYFQEKHKWNYASNMNISNSIKTYFDKEFKV